MLREFVVYCCDKRQLKFVRSKTAVYLDSRHFPVAQPMWDEVLLILFTCGTDQSQHQSAAQEGQQAVDESNELVAFFFLLTGKVPRHLVKYRSTLRTADRAEQRAQNRAMLQLEPQQARAQRHRWQVLPRWRAFSTKQRHRYRIATHKHYGGRRFWRQQVTYGVDCCAQALVSSPGKDCTFMEWSALFATNDFSSSLLKILLSTPTLGNRLLLMLHMCVRSILQCTCIHMPTHTAPP